MKKGTFNFYKWIITVVFVEYNLLLTMAERVARRTNPQFELPLSGVIVWFVIVVVIVSMWIISSLGEFVESQGGISFFEESK